MRGRDREPNDGPGKTIPKRIITPVATMRIPLLKLIPLLAVPLLCARTETLAASGNALALDGGVDYAWFSGTVFPTSSGLQSFTVEAWIYPTAASIAFIAADDCYDFKLYYQPGAPNGGLGVQFVLYDIYGQGLGFSEFRGVQLDQWNHVAAVFDAASGQMKLAINGILTSNPPTYTGGSLLVDPGYDFVVGQSGFDDAFFPGLIDELRVSEGVRYTTNFIPPGSYGADASARGLWHFDESAGSADFEDASGRGHALTGFNGAQTITPGGSSGPTITSITRMTPAAQTNHAQFVTWLVAFSEPVTGIDLTDFALVDFGGTVVGESLISVSASNSSLVQVTADTGSGGSGDLRLDVIYPFATITNASGSRLVTSFTSGEAYTMDKTRPTVVYINRLDPVSQTTSNASVVYRVRFSEPVVDIAPDDFTLTDVTGSITGESIASVSDSGGSMIDVTVDTGSSGGGQLRLDVAVPGATIWDNASNSLNGSYTSGQSYYIRTNLMPLMGVMPYTSDPYTVLLDHFEETTTARILGFIDDGEPCGPARPATPPDYAFCSGPQGLGDALILYPPPNVPPGSRTFLKYPGQLLMQTNGTVECWLFLPSYGASIHELNYVGECQGDVGGMNVESTGQLDATIWYTTTNSFALNSGPAVVPLNTWTHVALSWGSAGAKLYIDGALVGSNTNTGSFANWFGADSVFVSMSPGSSLDELRISSIQRTDFNLLTHPMLAINPVSTDIVLSWPQSAAGFHLQSATGPLSTASWNNVTNPVTTVGGRHEVALPTMNGSRFFRLIYP